MELEDILSSGSGTVLWSVADNLHQGLLDPRDLHRPISRVVVDSRQVEQDALFVALPGERTDGHQYVGRALEAGAMGAVVRRPPDHPLPDNKLLWVVEDSLAALQGMAAHWRRKQDIPVIGVTGSVGKTTVKESIAWTLEGLRPGSILKSEANLNTEIGLPLELLRLRSSHKAAVLEMGMYQQGDIALLARIAGPGIGVITNVLPVHLERTGSIERTAQGKAELAHALPPNGFGVFNGDDPWVRAIGASSPAPAVLYGFGPGRYDFTVSRVHGLGSQGFEATLRHGSREMAISCPTPGVHNAVNLLPALAIGHHLGLDWHTLADRASTFRLPGRLEYLEGPNGSMILDDRYNAAGASVLAAIRLLLESGGRHFAILGDMYELGSEEEAEHRRVGVAAQGLDGLILIGPRTRWIAEAAREAGLNPERIVRVEDNEQAVEMARSWLGPGDVVLVKGSRGMQLESIVEALATTKQGATA
ncbi:MAG TPA: UDP-N-acetylmuramoyl-tripeptide--D-alanyl-D-alanine ligase, partial [Chloroflexota bacterium]|nr:UDP-N-acetylmuramoyl-tripeptide--D-alanyl-D-alanine ligase [Chloroflexota bacterium]